MKLDSNNVALNGSDSKKYAINDDSENGISPLLNESRAS